MGCPCSVAHGGGASADERRGSGGSQSTSNAVPQVTVATTTTTIVNGQPTIAVTNSATNNPLVVPAPPSADQPSLHARSVVDPLRPLGDTGGTVGVETPNSSGAQPNDSADSGASSLNSTSSDIIGGGEPAVAPDSLSPTKGAAGERRVARPTTQDGTGNAGNSVAAPSTAQHTPQHLLRAGDEASNNSTTTATTTTTTNTSTNTTSATSHGSSFSHTPSERRVSGGDLAPAFTPVVASSLSSATTLANSSLTPRTGSDVFLPPRTQRRLTAEMGMDAASKRSSISSTSTGHSAGSKGGSVQGHGLELAKMGSSQALQLKAHSSNLSADWHDDGRGSVDGRRSSSVSISSPTTGSAKTGALGGSFRQRRVVLDSAASPADDRDKVPATLISPSSPYRHQRVPSHSAAVVDDDSDASLMSRFRPSPPRALPSYPATSAAQSFVPQEARGDQHSSLHALPTALNGDDDSDTTGPATRDAVVGRLRLNTSMLSSVQSARLKHDNSSTSLRGAVALPIPHAQGPPEGGDEEFTSARASSHHLRHGPASFQLEPSLSRSGAGSAVDLFGDSLSTPVHGQVPQPQGPARAPLRGATSEEPASGPHGSPQAVADTRSVNPALSPPNYQSGASAEEHVIQVQRRALVAVAPEQMLYGNERSISVDSFSEALQMHS